MSFTPSIPVSGQSLGSSRPQVSGNFAVLRSTISNTLQPNHIDVNSVGAGKHIFVQMPVQTTSAANLPAANEGGLITQSKSTGSELFYVRDAVAAYIQMTSGTIINAGAFPNNVGQTFLPGGYQLKWGPLGVPFNGTATVTFTTIVPTPLTAFPTAGLTGWVVSVQSGRIFDVAGLSQTTIQIHSSTGGTCIWFALGN